MENVEGIRAQVNGIIADANEDIGKMQQADSVRGEFGVFLLNFKGQLMVIRSALEGWQIKLSGTMPPINPGLADRTAALRSDNPKVSSAYFSFRAATEAAETDNQRFSNPENGIETLTNLIESLMEKAERLGVIAMEPTVSLPDSPGNAALHYTERAVGHLEDYRDHDL